MESSADFISSTPVVIRSQHLSYYVAISAILLVAWLFQSSQTSKAKAVKVPFYKASILKWYFDAETLVRDSYTKVRHTHSMWLLLIMANSCNSFMIKSTRSRRQRGFRCWYQRSLSAS